MKTSWYVPDGKQMLWVASTTEGEEEEEDSEYVSLALLVLFVLFALFASEGKLVVFPSKDKEPEEYVPSISDGCLVPCAW